MLAWQRFRALLLALRCPEAWRLPPRVSRTLAASRQLVRPAAAPSGTITYINCPPLGSRAFGRHLAGLGRISRGEAVPLAAHVSVTDRCGYRCARCSNFPSTAGDPPLDDLRRLLAALRDAGTVTAVLTGGEPCLRADLPEIVAACSPGMASLVFTSGQGFDAKLARALRSAGLGAVVVSLDHFEERAHDAVRGVPGAFRTALAAVDAGLGAGLYTAAQAVATPELLEGENPERFLEFCARLGVHDVILLEPARVRPEAPCPRLTGEQRRRLVELHLRSARDGRRPKVTAMPFLESPAFFGCQAGFSFLYVTAGGEVCPCDFVGESFGNAYREDLGAILARLRERFPRPTCRCLVPGREESAGGPADWDQMPAMIRALMPGDQATQ